MGRGMSDVNMI